MHCTVPLWSSTARTCRQAARGAAGLPACLLACLLSVLCGLLGCLPACLLACLVAWLDAEGSTWGLSREDLGALKERAEPGTRPDTMDSPRPSTTSANTSSAELLVGLWVWMTKAYAAGTTLCTGQLTVGGRLMSQDPTTSATEGGSQISSALMAGVHIALQWHCLRATQLGSTWAQGCCAARACSSSVMPMWVQWLGPKLHCSRQFERTHYKVREL